MLVKLNDFYEDDDVDYSNDDILFLIEFYFWKSKISFSIDWMGGYGWYWKLFMKVNIIL